MSSVQAAGAAEKDAVAYVAFLDTQPQVDKTKTIGTSGLLHGRRACRCRTAASCPGPRGRGGVVPRRRARDGQARQPAPAARRRSRRACYFGVAANDDERQPDAKDKLKESFTKAGVPAEVDVIQANVRLVRVRHADGGRRADL